MFCIFFVRFHLTRLSPLLPLSDERSRRTGRKGGIFKNIRDLILRTYKEVRCKVTQSNKINSMNRVIVKRSKQIRIWPTCKLDQREKKKKKKNVPQFQSYHYSRVGKYTESSMVRDKSSDIYTQSSIEFYWTKRG